MGQAGIEGCGPLVVASDDPSFDPGCGTLIVPHNPLFPGYAALARFAP